jgi:hypothetical protein
VCGRGKSSMRGVDRHRENVFLYSSCMILNMLKTSLHDQNKNT